MQNRNMFRNPRPMLVVESAGGGNIGRCYNSMSYRVTTTRPLTQNDIIKLREAGFLGYGQEFYFHQVVGNRPALVPAKVGYGEKPVEPSGQDEIPCVEEDYSGKPTGNVAKDYQGKPIPPKMEPFYVYHCESRVDSSD